MIFQRKFERRLKTVNGNITEEVCIDQRFLFGIKVYEEIVDYANEVTPNKTGFK